MIGLKVFSTEKFKIHQAFSAQNICICKNNFLDPNGTILRFSFEWKITFANAWLSVQIKLVQDKCAHMMNHNQYFSFG